MALDRRVREHVTATGIRIVGAQAAELVARAAELQLEPPPVSDLVWLARFRVRTRLGSGSPVPTLLDLLGQALREDWDACPAMDRLSEFSRPVGRFHGLSWEVAGEPGAWRGELIWRHLHPELPGTPATTHLVVDEQASRTTLTIGVALEGGLRGARGVVGAGRSRPPLLTALRQGLVLRANEDEGVPRILEAGAVADFVRDVLLDEQRAWPVAVLAPLEDDRYLVSPAQLAEEFFGLAPVYVLERHAATFRLTDAIGDRRLSAYFGALRIYKPEFSCADRSDDHWLLLREQVEDPLARAALVARVAQHAINRLAPISGVRRRALEAPPRPTSATTGEAPVVEAAITSTDSVAAPVAPSEPDASGTTLQRLEGEVRDLGGLLAHLIDGVARLADQLNRLRTATTIRVSSSQAVEERLAALERLLTPEVPDPAGAETMPARSSEEDPDRITLVDVVRHAAGEYGDSLLLLEAAEHAAAESPYRDPDRVAVVLQAMAEVSRRRQEGGLDTGLRAAFQELGIDYRSGIAASTSERLRRQYRFIAAEGREYDCHEHIVIGGTYDPRRCLRIYFTSRAPGESRFVIGHVGRHLEVMTSS